MQKRRERDREKISFKVTKCKLEFTGVCTCT